MLVLDQDDVGLAARLQGAELTVTAEGARTAPGGPIDSATLRGRSLRLLGYTNNELTPERRAASLALIAEQAMLGTLSVAHESMPLRDAGKAWRRQREGTATGRIVLIP
ncbi:hypothetical protein OG339_41980 [Streptosporangium sp. NBC_01495]|uniref:hypothetical protein n=1 Tax=Streptosporangium sp. NBC_01495 TaxID=2903899 RepID=UPI002E34464C|nr:hypothetical protein [Streptosporangium sp. NBC_01495]